MSAYPPECPLFRVTSDGPLVRLGALVECVGLAEGRARDVAGKLVKLVSTDGFLAMRVLDDAAAYPPRRRHLDGWIGLAMHPDGVEPLTPAAWEWLDVLRERTA